MVTEEQIKELAHAIWEQEGQPGGKDIEHYFCAKKILEERKEAPLSVPPELAPQPPPATKQNKRYTGKHRPKKA